MNYSEEQIKKALRCFIDDPQTAKKFAEAMRKGLEQAEDDKNHEDALVEEYNKEVCDLMELQGFTLWQTGGGCTAWGKHIFGGSDNASPYVLVTFSEGHDAYFESLADVHQSKSVMVCFYDANGDWLGSNMPIYYAWEEFKNNFKGGF